jgi:uncharacterized membrane protein
MSQPFSLLIPCIVILVAAVPMMLGLVPPNGFYGFRTRKTMSSPERWARANRFAGIALFLGAGLSIAVFMVNPALSSGRSLLGVAVLIVPLAVAIAASFIYVSRLP